MLPKIRYLPKPGEQVAEAPWRTAEAISEDLKAKVGYWKGEAEAWKRSSELSQALLTTYKVGVDEYIAKVSGGAVGLQTALADLTASVSRFELPSWFSGLGTGALVALGIGGAVLLVLGLKK